MEAFLTNIHKKMPAKLKSRNHLQHATPGTNNSLSSDRLNAENSDEEQNQQESFKLEGNSKSVYTAAKIFIKSNINSLLKNVSVKNTHTQQESSRAGSQQDKFAKLFGSNSEIV